MFKILCSWGDGSVSEVNAYCVSMRSWIPRTHTKLHVLASVCVTSVHTVRWEVGTKESIQSHVSQLSWYTQQ